jgi:type VI secretion system protein ImpE
MRSAELVHSGQLEDGLKALQAEIREKPEDIRLRIFLFQLDCVLGEFGKALNQLQAMASLNADTMLLAQIFRPVIACELLRREVFADRRTPLILGEPQNWMGLMVQASNLIAGGEFAAAARLRAQAFEEAPVSSGTMDGKQFEWIADADSRLGPMIEAIFEGKYYWIPFCHIRKIEIEKPSDLRDLVWLPAQITWTNGGAVCVHLPVRYPGTEQSSDSALRLSRKTDWEEKPGETFLGLGQRILATNEQEYPLLECRIIEMAPAAS